MSFIFYYWHFRLVFPRLANVWTGCFLIGSIYTGFGFCGSGPSTWVGLSTSSALGGRSLTEGAVGFSLLEVFVTEKWIPPWLSSHGLWLIVHFGPYYLVLLLPLQHWREDVMATINLVPIHSAQKQVSLLLLHPSSCAWRLTQNINTEKPHSQAFKERLRTLEPADWWIHIFSLHGSLEGVYA